MATSREMFTASELESVLQELEVETFLDIRQEPDGDTTATIDCDFGDLSWLLMLGDESPFYSTAMLLHITHVGPDVDPFRFVNSWNDSHLESVAIVSIDDKTGESVVDEEGNTTIVIRKFIFFHGSMTESHLSFQFEVWMDDLSDLVNEDEESSVEQEVRVAVDTLNTAGPSDLDAIHLLLIENGPMSSKEIARALVLPKHEVNHIVYMFLEEFEKHHGQPPKWSSRRQ